MKLSAIVQILFVCFAIALIVFFRQTPEFTTLSITFVSIFLEALPFMLLGSLASGIIEVFVSQERIAAPIVNPLVAVSTAVLAVNLPFYSDNHNHICGCGHEHCHNEQDSFFSRLILRLLTNTNPSYLLILRHILTGSV